LKLNNRRSLLAAVGFIVFLIGGCAGEGGQSSSTNRVVLIGIDGLDYQEALEIDEGACCENIASILANSSWGSMKSTTPPISPAAWGAIVTGKNPGKTDILTFSNLVKGSRYSARVINGADFKVNKLWQILSERGRRSIVIGIPLSFPPDEIDGIVVSGWLSRRGRTFVYPESFADSVVAWGYSPQPRGGSKSLSMESQFASIDERRDLAVRLIKRPDWDFFTVQFEHVDQISHASGATPEMRAQVLRKVDDALGDILPLIPEDATLVFLSDHGGTWFEKLFNEKYWLWENGYNDYLLPYDEFAETYSRDYVTDFELRVQSRSPISGAQLVDCDSEDQLIATSRELVVSFSILEGMKGIVWNSATIPENAVVYINGNGPHRLMFLSSPGARTRLPKPSQHTDLYYTYDRVENGFAIAIRADVDSEKINPLDLAGSDFFNFFATESHYGVLTMNLVGREPAGTVAPEDYYELCDQICRDLKALIDPTTGERIVTDCWRGRDLYEGIYDRWRPDVVYRLKEDYHVKWKRWDTDVVEDVGGYHHRELGVLAFSGRNVVPGSRLEFDIYDIAPTMLYLMGEPIASDMDGKVIYDIVEPSYAAENSPTYVETYETGAEEDVEFIEAEPDSELIELLESLGYL
jgi:predicted AlkP superfamily phosphohydrolase/phosphomutase